MKKKLIYIFLGFTFALLLGASIKGQVTLVNIGSSHFAYKYGAPAGPLPASTDIKIRAVSCIDATEIDNDAIGGYDLLLVEDGY